MLTIALARYPRTPFFVHWYRNPRVLLSFPTRRSSDLGFDGYRGPGLRPGAGPKDSNCDVAGPPLERRDDVLLCEVTFRLCRRVRSEEHTSELQSRFDFVCRLLLEKK